MVNYRVEDLAGLLKALREEGCNVLEKTDDSEYGKFGWVMDPEGNKVALATATRAMKRPRFRPPPLHRSDLRAPPRRGGTGLEDRTNISEERHNARTPLCVQSRASTPVEGTGGRND